MSFHYTSPKKKSLEVRKVRKKGGGGKLIGDLFRFLLCFSPGFRCKIVGGMILVPDKQCQQQKSWEHFLGFFLANSQHFGRSAPWSALPRPKNRWSGRATVIRGGGGRRGGGWAKPVLITLYHLSHQVPSKKSNFLHAAGQICVHTVAWTRRCPPPPLTLARESENIKTLLFGQNFWDTKYRWEREGKHKK